MHLYEEKRLSGQFAAFCVKVLKNEACNINREYRRRLINTKPICGLAQKEVLQIAANTDYFAQEFIFYVGDKPIVVVGNTLATALNKLSKESRNIILLSYFVGMSDSKIGELFGVVKQTIAYRRNNALNRLKQALMEEELYDGIK